MRRVGTDTGRSLESRARAMEAAAVGVVIAWTGLGLPRTRHGEVNGFGNVGGCDKCTGHQHSALLHLAPAGSVHAPWHGLQLGKTTCSLRLSWSWKGHSVHVPHTVGLQSLQSVGLGMCLPLTKALPPPRGHRLR